MHVLVTGGAGYVGSHVVHALLGAGHRVTVIDDLSSGHRGALPDEVELLVARCGDTTALESAFTEAPAGIMHLAAKCSVEESMTAPRRYYRANVIDSLRLMDWAVDRGVPWLIHSSTCAVYGVPQTGVLAETHPENPINPYGASKATVDRALRFYADAYDLGATSLRYFNAAGAGENGSLGEDKTPASNLVPAVLEVAAGRRETVTVFGTDYDTPDGTGVRDYVHVADLAAAHLAAMTALVDGSPGGVYNLGTGRGHSVREVIETARRVTGHEIPAHPGPRRPGDPPRLVAAAGRAGAELGWKPRRSDLDVMLEDAWAWHRAHPDGYGSGAS